MFCLDEAFQLYSHITVIAVMIIKYRNTEMLCCDILVGYCQSRDCDNFVGYIHSGLLRLYPGSICLANVKSSDAVRFMKVVDEINAIEEIVDEYGHKIIES